MLRIGVLTGGGDVPGLNPCIKQIVNRAVDAGHEVYGIRRGWGGLLNYNTDVVQRGKVQLGHAAHQDSGAHGRPHGRHVPAHLAHESRKCARQPGARTF